MERIISLSTIWLHFAKIFFWFIFKWYFRLWILFLYSCINYILKFKSKSINYKFWTISLFFPCNLLTLLVISEIFVFWLLKKLKWCSHVLDIWWFIWESAIYLSLNNNNKVSVYEPDKQSYELLLKNVNRYKNITPYNSFVGVKSWMTTISKREEIDCGASLSHENDSKELLPIISIKDILLDKSIDWLKMDIEGWEYEILDYLLDNFEFNFKKWFIEFHFHWEFYKSKEKFIHFYEKILTLWYEVEIFDNCYSAINVKDVDLKWLLLCNLFFEKIWN